MEAGEEEGGKGVLTFTRVQNQREFLSPLRGSQQQGSHSQGIPLQCPLLHLLTQSSSLRERKHSLKATWLWTWLQQARQTAPSMDWVFTLRCENLWTAHHVRSSSGASSFTPTAQWAAFVFWMQLNYHFNKMLDLLKLGSVTNSHIHWMSWEG